MIMRARSTIILILLVSVALCSGCGYEDQNTKAAGIVAEAYLRAYVQHEPAMACRVLVPALMANFAAASGGSCEKHVEATFGPNQSGLRVGSVVRSGNSATAYAVGNHAHSVTLVKFGSLWRVADSWLIR
jgi:hypothetical protein